MDGMEVHYTLYRHTSRCDTHETFLGSSCNLSKLRRKCKLKVTDMKVKVIIILSKILRTYKL